MHDLLEDPLISVRRTDGEARVSLPELLAELSAGRVEAYPCLRAHQQDAFHVMTVQLAASVLAREQCDAAPMDAAFWRRGLLNLADGQRSAWHLIEEDPTKPAFLQSPCVSREDFMSSFKPKALTPDELDVVITAKNHDVKGSRASADSIELWLAALIVTQTTSGFLGRGNYGVIRMNGGFGSRTFVSTIKDPRPGPRFCEEAPIVAELRRDALGSSYGYSDHGSTLTWLKAWTRKAPQHRISDLTPTFIEAARPIRLVESGRGLVALGAVSDAQQVAGPENGDCGDPWTVLNLSDRKKGLSALTVSGNGLTPKLLTDILFEQGYQLTALQRPRTGGGRTWLCASVLVRGQGTTDGFHQVRIAIPERARSVLLNSGERDRFATLAKQLLADSATIEGRCLSTALIAMCEGGPDDIDYKKDPIVAWARKSAAALQPRWKAAYFPTLWDAVDRPAELVRSDWVCQLVEHARAILAEAERTVPIPSSRRLRASVRARDVLEATLRKNGLIELIKEQR